MLEARRSWDAGGCTRHTRAEMLEDARGTPGAGMPEDAQGTAELGCRRHSKAGASRGGILGGMLELKDAGDTLEPALLEAHRSQKVLEAPWSWGMPEPGAGPILPSRCAPGPAPTATLAPHMLPHHRLAGPPGPQLPALPTPRRAGPQGEPLRCRCGQRTWGQDLQGRVPSPADIETHIPGQGCLGQVGGGHRGTLRATHHGVTEQPQQAQRGLWCSQGDSVSDMASPSLGPLLSPGPPSSSPARPPPPAPQWGKKKLF